MSASASPVPLGTNPLEDGENITVVYNIDFIAAFGVGQLTESVTVEVFRKNTLGDLVQIGTSTGPLVATAEGPGLEVNHGPVGPPQAGDCWDSFTPDIVPYDLVRVTNNDTNDVDEVLIDELTFDDAAVVGGEAHYTGIAKFANGTPIPALELNSGFWRTNVGGLDSRGEGPLVEIDADGNYTARWQPPDFGVLPGKPVPTAADVANADRQEFGYGHVAPLPAETQLADGVGNSPGPALGCEASVSESDSVRTATPDPLTLASGALEITGTKMTGASDTVEVTLSDGTNPVAPLAATVVGNDWTLSVPRAAAGPGNSWDDLNDGVITISGAFVHGGDTIGGQTLRIRKDTAPPAQPPTDPPATGAGGAAGGATGTTTGGGTTTGAGTQTTPLDPTTLQVSGLRTRSRISRRGARRNGVAASFLVPDGARVLRVELHSTDRARAARLIGIKDVALSAGGRQVVRLNSRRTRGLLRPGLYRLVIQVGDGSQLGPRVVKRIRVVR